ncbi:hypothetical protein FOL47_005151 [Perkinsus chesapeaki]|uniref:Uncharacterized protein n=1 Tax=Perkinsus chesapeaki TaxID=330153 RepID=A0A7J6LZI9_PERCH|nr:hypothetical protein FOL47_005151 [Perkinsus chesapeaki]
MSSCRIAGCAGVHKLIRSLLAIGYFGMAVEETAGTTAKRSGEQECWMTKIAESWDEASEWWWKVYKVTWEDQPQNVYNLIAITFSFIIIVISFILGSKHISRTIEEDARIHAASADAVIEAADDSQEDEGGEDASAPEEEGDEMAAKKKAPKKSSKASTSSKARGRSTERKGDEAEPKKGSTKTKARSTSRAARPATPVSPASSAKSGKGTPKSSNKRRSSRPRAAVTDRVATACLEGLEATLKGQHSLQVEVTKRGVWGNYFVLEIRLVGVPYDAVSKSKGLLIGGMINLFRVTACSDASYTNVMVFRNAERLLEQRLPAEVAEKLAENGVEADVVIKSNKEEQELYQTIMIHQVVRDEDSDDDSDWSIEKEYVIVDPVQDGTTTTRSRIHALSR